MPWIPRGLRDGIVTTKYPRESDGYGSGFRGTVEVNAGRTRQIPVGVVESCPTHAIDVGADSVKLDRGKCVLCGVCVRLAPQVFSFAPSVETAGLSRGALVVPEMAESSEELDALRRALDQRVRAFRRSIHVRHVDVGSDGSDEWEVAALTNPIYDVQRLGIYFTASPRHADVLLVTGAGTAGMAESLRHTLEVMPNPKVVIAAGTEAVSAGVVANGYVTQHGVSSLIDVDVYVPGSPATPFGLLYGILMAVNLLPRHGNAGGSG